MEMRRNRGRASRYEAPAVEELGQIHEVAERQSSAAVQASHDEDERDEGYALQRV